MISSNRYIELFTELYLSTDDKVNIRHLGSFARAKVLVSFLETIQSKRHIVFLSLAACLLSNERVLSICHVQAVMMFPTGGCENIIVTTNC